MQDAFVAEQLMPEVLQPEENIGGLPAGVPWSFDVGYESEKHQVPLR